MEEICQVHPNTVLLLTYNGELILIQFNNIVGTVKEWKIK
jgi:hypothetical protein